MQDLGYFTVFYGQKNGQMGKIVDDKQPHGG